MFNQAKLYVIAACLLAFLVWFVGFMVVAGEWFAMWQSTTWNFQQGAFRFYATVLLVLIFVNQPDGDLVASAPAPLESAVPKAKPERAPRRRRTDKGRRRTDRD